MDTTIRNPKRNSTASKNNAINGETSEQSKPAIKTVIAGASSFTKQPTHNPLQGEQREAITKWSESINTADGSMFIGEINGVKGVYLEINDEKNRTRYVRISSQLKIVGRTRDTDGRNWGYLLQITDPDNRIHTWAMPAALLKGNGEEYRERLLSLGLDIAPGTRARSLLTVFIQSSNPEKRVLCVSRCGWHDTSFMLADGTLIGCQSDEELVLQIDKIPDGAHRNG